MKIGAKLIVGFLSVAAIALIIGVIGYVQIHKVDERGTLLYEKVTVPLGELGHISVLFQRERINVRDLITAETAQERAECAATIAKLRTEIGERADVFEKTILTEQGRKEFDDFKKSRAAYGDAVAQIERLVAADQIEPPPRMGMQLKSEFIRGMGKQGESFIIILDIDKIFSSDELCVMQMAEDEKALA